MEGSSAAGGLRRTYLLEGMGLAESLDSLLEIFDNHRMLDGSQFPRRDSVCWRIGTMAPHGPRNGVFSALLVRGHQGSRRLDLHERSHKRSSGFQD